MYSAITTFLVLCTVILLLLVGAWFYAKCQIIQFDGIAFKYVQISCIVSP